MSVRNMQTKQHTTEGGYAKKKTRTTRDFSSKYSDICAPVMVPFSSNFSSVYLPNRELLLFMTVRAFPNDSSSGFTWIIFSSSECPSEPTHSLWWVGGIYHGATASLATAVRDRAQRPCESVHTSR
jgi:hypothetical protein